MGPAWWPAMLLQVRFSGQSPPGRPLPASSSHATPPWALAWRHASPPAAPHSLIRSEPGRVPESEQWPERSVRVMVGVDISSSFAKQQGKRRVDFRHAFTPSSHNNVVTTHVRPVFTWPAAFNLDLCRVYRWSRHQACSCVKPTDDDSIG